MISLFAFAIVLPRHLVLIAAIVLAVIAAAVLVWRLVAAVRSRPR